MDKVSVIIPSRNETFLNKTVKGLLDNAAGDVEVIVCLDGVMPDDLIHDKRVVYLYPHNSRGMRWGINGCAAIARGKYLMKIDGHCLVGEGYDEILQKDCDNNWVVIPRRYSLDEDNWIRREDKPPVDYEYLRYPFYKPDEIGIHGTVWPQRARERSEYPIDDNMAFQGSCWFTTKKFFDSIGGLSEEGYGTFIGEPQEIGNKAWLSGGAVKVNKIAWYAHLHKGKKWGRGYFMDKRETNAGNLYSVDFWYNDRWEQRTRDFEWLIEKFWPVPTWPGMKRESWEAFDGQR